ncbi:MAG: hydrogenase [Polyangiaceae bacterium]|nr:hydrogenase [Polyangiaceae bacterium]
MDDVALIAVPLAGALLSFAIPSERARPFVLPVTGAAHLGLTLNAIASPAPSLGVASAWLSLDPLGGLVLALVSALFFLCALYAPAYLRVREDRPNRILCLCLHFFLAMASLVALSQHLGLLWVAVEGTTLATAPLLYFNKNARSIEATWKYLVVGSVGIALALLGSLFLAYALHLAGGETSLVFSSMIAGAKGMSAPWLRVAFVFLLVGYGTKMGLAPLHTWKPDAYGEAPGMVGALLAGGMSSAVFLALLRVYAIVGAAGEGPFARELLIGMGFISIGLAAVFLVRQQDFKRMLAYSSVEQMGILVLGVGLGGAGVWAALLHTLNNGLAKAVLFLSAANIHRAFGSKSISAVTGARRVLPWSSGLFLAGLFAVTGSPPFGPFVSSFAILRRALSEGRYVVAALFLILLGAVFVGMGATVLAVVQGSPREGAVTIRQRDSFWNVLPIAVALGLLLMLGVWIPAPLSALLDRAAAMVEVAR